MRMNPNWTAKRSGHDWRDDELMLAVAWLKSFVPRIQMERRLDAAKERLLEARKQMREGLQVPFFDPADVAAWYILQAETFAYDRAYWTPEGAMRIAPYLTRIGKELPLLLSVRNVEERAARIMLAERRQPDGGIFELLVGLAYRRGGWTDVEFVQEKRGLERTPDLHVSRPRSHWAVECKRLAVSSYATKENQRGIVLAEKVHAFLLEQYRSSVVEVVYKVELEDVPDEYLVGRVQAAMERASTEPVEDEIGAIRVRPVNWELTRSVLREDYVYYGSTRMIELLAGSYAHDANHSMAAKWRPWEDRPEYADAVYQASVVTWQSASAAATRQKARHFKKTLVDANGQLPGDRPGAIHIGIESYSGAKIDAFRHVRNSLQSRYFDPGKSRLRWVYGNYFVPEATTRQDESWAFTETMVPYRVGSHRTKWPLPDHMLVSPEGKNFSGMHWDGRDFH